MCVRKTQYTSGPTTGYTQELLANAGDSRWAHSRLARAGWLMIWYASLDTENLESAADEVQAGVQSANRHSGRFLLLRSCAPRLTSVWAAGSP
jgi:hypothetical protein